MCCALVLWLNISVEEGSSFLGSVTFGGSAVAPGGALRCRVAVGGGGYSAFISEGQSRVGSPEPPPPLAQGFPLGPPLAALETVSVVSVFGSLSVMCLGVIFLCVSYCGEPALGLWKLSVYVFHQVWVDLSCQFSSCFPCPSFPGSQACACGTFIAPFSDSAVFKASHRHAATSLQLPLPPQSLLFPFPGFPPDGSV